MYCPKCGRPINDNAVFCSSCGNRIDEEKTATLPYENDDKTVILDELQTHNFNNDDEDLLVDLGSNHKNGYIKIIGSIFIVGIVIGLLTAFKPWRLISSTENTSKSSKSGEDTKVTEKSEVKDSSAVSDETDSTGQSNSYGAQESESNTWTVQVLVRNLRIRSTPYALADESNFNDKYAEMGRTYTVYESVKSDGYIWYRIGDHEWIASNEGKWTIEHKY